MGKKRNTPQLTRYPFVVNKNKAVAVIADSLHNAINKVLAKNPNTFVTTTYAKAVDKYITRMNDTDRVIVTRRKNGSSSASLITDDDIIENILPKITTKLKHKLFMDLQNARKKAALQSKDGKYVYVNVRPAGDKDEGDCYLSDKADETTYAAFKNGSEIAIPVKTEKKKTAKEEADEVPQSIKNKKVMATKEAKKAPAKKVAAKKVPAQTPAKETKPAKKIAGKKEIPIKEIIKLLKSGTKVYNHADKSLTLGYMEKMKDPTRTMPVSY